MTCANHHHHFKDHLNLAKLKIYHSRKLIIHELYLNRLILILPKAAMQPQLAKKGKFNEVS